MNLSLFAAQYCAARPLSACYAQRLRDRVAALESHVGCAGVACTLTETTVNGFLRSLALSPFTVRCYRADLLTIWNSAADDDLVPYPVARRLFMPDVPELIVECYEVDEARALLEAAGKVRRNYPNGVERAKYWGAAIRLAWDSGIRRGDVWRFRRDYIRRDGTLRMVQHKTGRQLMARLRESTVAALDAIGRKQPCEWTLDPRYFDRQFQRIVKASGVNRGTFRWLRRSSGSYVEMQQPGSGHKHLGHTNPATFSKHYDGRLGGHNLPQPPEL